MMGGPLSAQWPLELNLITAYGEGGITDFSHCAQLAFLQFYQNPE
jgi:hypothetical protein